MPTNIFDVIIIGGSYAGLSAAMSLGRARRNVLVIDGGDPCNKQTPHSHNFITHDGDTPSAIAAQAKAEVEKYDTVEFVNGLVISGRKEDNLFTVTLESGEEFSAKKLLFATGLKDVIPGIPGFSECWGISILHCPYCHGYEVRDKKIGIFANGPIGFHLVKLLQQWSKELQLFTNGESTLSQEEKLKLKEHNIPTIEKKISHFEHNNGQIRNVIFEDDTSEAVMALFAGVPIEQKSDFPKMLGCEINAQGFIKIDEMQRTTVSGIYAAGDNSSGMRAVSIVIAAGSKAGAVINGELIEEKF